MPVPVLSVIAWKRLMGGLCLLMAAALLIEAGQAMRPLVFDDGHQGSLGVQFEDSLGLARLDGESLGARIVALAPDSELALNHGARPGDHLVFTPMTDRWRKPRPGETWTLGLIKPDGSELAVQVTASRVPVPMSDWFDYAGRLLLAGPALLFAWLIARNQPESFSYRALATGFLLLSLSAFIGFNYAPAGLFLGLFKTLGVVSPPLVLYALARFCMQYQALARSPLTRRWRRVLTVYRMLVAAAVAHTLWYLSGHRAPGLHGLNTLAIVAGQALCYVSLIATWRQARGHVRQRTAWLLASLALGGLPTALIWVPALQDWEVSGVRGTILALFIGQALMFVGLAYAVLRHRVFDFDFAVNRAIVFSLISLLLVAAFGVTKWLLEHQLAGPSGHHESNLLLDGALAAVIYMFFHHLHERLEKRVKVLFFHDWHIKDQQLRKFARQSLHITSSEALLQGLHQALERFSDESGCVIYLRLVGGAFAQVFNSLPLAAHVLDADDPLLVALRAEASAQNISELASESHGVLALPLMRRAELMGAVVLGAKPRGGSYRPDEINTLEFVAQQLSLDLQALNAAKLEQVEQQQALHAELGKAAA